MHKLAPIFCLVFCLCCTCLCFSQETYYFSKGLGATIPSRYGREALYTDELAYRLYTNTLKTPVEGATFGVNERGQNIVWQAIKTDSIHRFRPATRGFGGQGGGLGGRGAGYLYLTYESP